MRNRRISKDGEPVIRHGLVLHRAAHGNIRIASAPIRRKYLHKAIDALCEDVYKRQSVDYPTTVRFIGEKEIHESTLRLQENDLIVLMTAGITNAGVGKVMQDGWARKDVIECLERWYTPVSSTHLDVYKRQLPSVMA